MNDYHDKEWGVPTHDDKKHFEFLVLEGAQAGLSWTTILKKRNGYQKAFANFDPKKVAKFTKKDIEKLLKNNDIIRNKLKIEATINNAKRFLEIQKEFENFDNFIWSFVGGKSIVNEWKSMEEVPPTSKQSLELSRELKKRGFKFVGPTIIYAYMQAIGIVNDHVMNCFRYNQIANTSNAKSNLTFSTSSFRNIE